MRSMCLALVSLLAVGCSFPSGAEPADPIDERDQWQEKQQVLRQVIRVDVPSAAGPTTTWLFWERTPHRRLKIGAAPSPDGKPEFIFLQQEDVVMVMEGQEPNMPAAPWMLGVKLMDEMLEPAMFQSWTLGLPGRAVFEGSDRAEVSVSNGEVTQIRQEGWSINYTEWQPASPDRPALPRQFEMCKKDKCATVTSVISEAYTMPPESYSEFSIW